MYSLGPLGSGCPFPALPGLPGSSTDLSLRAVPNHPGRSGECLLIASPPVSGFIILGRLATSTLRHEAESGSLALRLAGLLPRFPPEGLRRLAPVQLHARMSNLHGEFLFSFQFTRSARLSLVYRMNTDKTVLCSRLLIRVYPCSSVTRFFVLQSPASSSRYRADWARAMVSQL
jgi:hypothetical protein